MWMGHRDVERPFCSFSPVTKHSVRQVTRGSRSVMSGRVTKPVKSFGVCSSVPSEGVCGEEDRGWVLGVETQQEKEQDWPADLCSVSCRDPQS